MGKTGLWLMGAALIAALAIGCGKDEEGVRPDEAEAAAEAEPAPVAHEDIQVPEGIDVEQTSKDPTYGYTQDNPIKVGGPPGFSGPESERLYLRHLRGADFAPLDFVREGSVGAGADGHILDLYLLTSHDGKKTYTLYLDMYHSDVHPFDVKAPKGLYFWM